VVRVKVYPGSATVERVLRLAPGARQAGFACLPAQLDVASLQVAGDGGVRVGEIAVSQRPRESLGNACPSPLDERIRALEDQIAELEAENAGIGYALGYLKSFEGADGGVGARSERAEIGATAAALRQNGQSALARRHQIERQKEALTRDLNPLLAEREMSTSPQARVSMVRITVAAPQGGELRLSYQVRGPGWQPIYRATLDTVTKKVRLERQALVAQNTGEDWDGVQLTLSTGQPTAATQGPLPAPWRVGIALPREDAVLARAPMMAVPAPAPAFARNREGSEVASFEPIVTEGGFATEFAVPQRIGVPANGQRVTLVLGEQTQEARVLVRATPARQAAAFLVAEIAPPPGVWPAGPVNLYRDGAYVGSGRFDPARLALDGLSFGRDESVDVRAEPPTRSDGTGGFIGSRNERRVGQSFVVENRHREGIVLQVLDGAPLSEHQDVRVESRFQPEPRSRNWNEQPGTVLWEQPLAAGAAQRFGAEHVITWPKDARLRE
jgi:uncharacterized protein (TIGR02231 family)